MSRFRFITRYFILGLAFILASCGRFTPDIEDYRVLLGRLAGEAAQSILAELNHPSAAGFIQPGYGQDGSFGTPTGIAVRLVGPGERERGCLAFFDHIADLQGAARVAAVDAARFDGRYPPVTAAELDTLSVEVCLFFGIGRIDDPFDFRLGVDSVLLREAGRHAIIQAPLAPQRGWDRFQFLQAICRKAGLPQDAFLKNDAKVYVLPTVYRRIPFMMALTIR